MQGKSHPETGAKLTITSNYEQYGLQWPVGLVRMDVHRHPFRTGLTEVGVSDCLRLQTAVWVVVVGFMPA